MCLLDGSTVTTTFTMAVAPVLPNMYTRPPRDRDHERHRQVRLGSGTNAEPQRCQMGVSAAAGPFWCYSGHSGLNFSTVRSKDPPWSAIVSFPATPPPPLTESEESFISSGCHSAQEPRSKRSMCQHGHGGLSIHGCTPGGARDMDEGTSGFSGRIGAILPLAEGSALGPCRYW